MRSRSPSVVARSSSKPAELRLRLADGALAGGALGLGGGKRTGGGGELRLPCVDGGGSVLGRRGGGDNLSLRFGRLSRLSFASSASSRSAAALASPPISPSWRRSASACARRAISSLPARLPLRLLAVDLRSGDLQALKLRRRGSRLVAQRREPGGHFRLGPPRLGLRRGNLGEMRSGGKKLSLRLGEARERAFPVDDVEDRLGACGSLRRSCGSAQPGAPGASARRAGPRSRP